MGDIQKRMAEDFLDDFVMETRDMVKGAIRGCD
jgi:hypothetical protein